jgi:hypothetical protein
LDGEKYSTASSGAEASPEAAIVRMEEDRDLDPLIDPGLLSPSGDASYRGADGGAGRREASGAEGCGRGERRGGHRECVRRGGVGTPRTMGGRYRLQMMSYPKRQWKILRLTSDSGPDLGLYHDW